MTTFIDDVDDGVAHPAPFEVDGIRYDPYEAANEAADRPPMFDLLDPEDCYCAAYRLAPWDTCSWDAYHWVPGRSDMPPLRFGAKPDGGA